MNFLWACLRSLFLIIPHGSRRVRGYIFQDWRPHSGSWLFWCCQYLLLLLTHFVMRLRLTIFSKWLCKLDLGPFKFLHTFWGARRLLHLPHVHGFVGRVWIDKLFFIVLDGVIGDIRTLMTCIVGLVLEQLLTLQIIKRICFVA